jgi:hypothetical protein
MMILTLAITLGVLAATAAGAARELAADTQARSPVGEPPEPRSQLTDGNGDRRT